ncbi:MAG TPA: heavy metal-responsive transcriptional regulator [Egibacteraceae bacterium]|jgi:DNA-binding transcriptional MerR regulator|nr:heavy metal-responsive transcriptional regulator [Egibacteraceae bacterium]
MLIGALADATGVPAKTLRYWEAQGLLREPARTHGGYRDYPDDTAERVAFIRHAQAAGLTLRQIREIVAIRDGGKAPCAHAADLVDERLTEVEARLRELEETRTALRGLRRRLRALDPADCDPASVCSAITTPARERAGGPTSPST